jgi:hypothetical protein
MLEPDTLSSHQYFDQWRGAGHLQPELRLMLAVLQEAVDCYQENVFLRGRKQEELFKDAEKWFFEEVHEWPFSFVNICEAVGIHPQYLRNGLSRWKHKARAAISTRYKIRIQPATTPTLASPAH